MKRGFHLRTDDLTPVNQDAIERYHWPGNFAELREIADAITAHATLGGLRPAAASLRVSRQKLSRRLARAGLKLPLFCQDEILDRAPGATPA